MPELTIAVFNLHWGVDMDGRPYDTLGPCLELDADVLVLPEVWRPHGQPAMVDELAARTGATLHQVSFMSDRNSNRPRHLAPPPGPAGSLELSVLSRLPVRSFTTVPLPRASGDVLERRHAIIVEVDVDGAAVAVGGIHASHRIWGALPQLRQLDRDLRARGLPSAIAGDCNMWGPPIRLALPGRVQAVRGRSWPGWRPHSQIDHVWVDDGLAAIDGRVGPATGSDHRAVVARVRVR